MTDEEIIKQTEKNINQAIEYLTLLKTELPDESQGDWNNLKAPWKISWGFRKHFMEETRKLTHFMKFFHSFMGAECFDIEGAFADFKLEDKELSEEWIETLFNKETKK